MSNGYQSDVTRFFAACCEATKVCGANNFRLTILVSNPGITVMKVKISFFSILILLIVSNPAYSEECGRDCQKENIENYFMYLSKVYRKGSSQRDVDNLFELLHANVTYEHFEYGANFDRNDWIAAFKRNLEGGAYSAGQNDGIRVENYIYGRHHVAVEYSYGQVAADGAWEPKGDQELFALFGFSGSKIIQVREYW